MDQIRDLFEFFSNLTRTIFLIFYMELKANIGHISPKTAYPGKFVFWSYGLNNQIKETSKKTHNRSKTDVTHFTK